jgi:hypothetical protein
LSGILVGCALIGACAFGAARASVEPFQKGVFALLGGKQQTVAHFWAVGSGHAPTLKVQQFQMDGTTPILNYRIDMGTTAHMFLIRDDFATFQHHNADFNTGTGAFSHTFTKEANHKYYLYTDSGPYQMHRQVFRFTIESEGPVAASNPSTSASATTESAGDGYTVVMAKTTLDANKPFVMDVTVDRGGKAAQDLSPFFGSAAHMVMIDSSSLEYVSLHPVLKGEKLDTSLSYTVEQELQRLQTNSKTGPNMQVAIPPLPAGTYKAWYEFIGGVSQHHYVAPFTFVVQ